MMWISIALIVIVTEAIFYDLYKESRKQEPKKENVVDYEERLKALEDQVSSIRVAQGMRRRDG